MNAEAATQQPGPGRIAPAISTAPDVFYRTVLESLSEGVLIADAEQRVRYANRRVADITGYEPEELTGRTVAEMLLPAGHRQREACQHHDALSKDADCVEIEIRRKDGELHWVRLRTTPYLNEEGAVAGTVAALECIKRQKGLEFENEFLLDDARLNFGDIIGKSAIWQKILAQIATVAPTEANVLVLGESGTGKELVARAIHERSAHKDRALVRVNCASIPKDLFESEFFGHARGAFTGAIRDRVGRFELADHGTLFLDEIGEIPLDLQSKLLRVLQEGQFERLGEDRTRTVRVRIIAATNRELLTEAKAGRFRLDLYYRLSVFPIELPPLRERPEDIGPLAAHFVQHSARRLGVERPRLTRAQVQQLEGYDWPGNVRELQNVVERAVILARGGRLQFDLPTRGPSAPIPRGGASARSGQGSESAAADGAEPLSLDELVAREREIVVAALRRARSKIYGADGAAAILRIKPTTLVSKMKRLQVEKER